MAHGIETPSRGAGRELTRGQVAALAEEAATYAETALAMAGMDGFAAVVRPVPATHDRRGLDVTFRDGADRPLCVTLRVTRDGLVGIAVAGPAAGRTGRPPSRNRRGFDDLVADLAVTLREAVVMQVDH